MGRRAGLKPNKPALEWVSVAPEQRYVSQALAGVQYLQALEGGIDSSHVSFLAFRSAEERPVVRRQQGNEYNDQDRMPQFDVSSRRRAFNRARRNAENDRYYWRITPWIMPRHTIIPPARGHRSARTCGCRATNENTWAWSINYHPKRALTDAELTAMKAGKGIHVEYVPGTFIRARISITILDRSRRTGNGRAFFGCRRHCDARRFAAGIHGPDPGPHA